MLAYIGALLIMMAALLAWRLYRSFLREQLGYTRSLLGALEDYRDKVRTYLCSPSEWAADYTDARLESVGFLARVREGESFAQAYASSCGACYLPSGVDAVLSSLLSRLGEGYLEGELEIVGTALTRLRSEESRITEEYAKRERVAGALLGACAVGVLIFIA